MPAPEPALAPGRVSEQLEALAALADPGQPGYTRLALTDRDRLGRDFVIAWMRRIGLEVQVDVVGNVFGTLAGAAASEPIMVGSHIDTVEQGGRFDGCYGVIAGVAVAECIAASGRALRRPLVVAIFTNEEGVRFQPDLLGSRVLTGELVADDALGTRDGAGVSVGDALAAIGYGGGEPYRGALPTDFVELHIEQGPVLEQTGAQIGLVTGIAGFFWVAASFHGQSDHAGSTPMLLRRDAGQGAMELAALVDGLARRGEAGLVATVGSVTLHPGDINVVPGRADMTIDVRATDQRVLDETRQEIVRLGEDIARARGLEFRFEVVSESPVVVMDPRVVGTVEAAAAAAGHSAMPLWSGAAHDTQSLSRVTSTGMIFVPSAGGRSHCPEEYTPPADLDRGAEVLLQTILRLNDERSD